MRPSPLGTKLAVILWEVLHAKIVRAASDLNTVYQTLYFHVIDAINLIILEQ